MPGHLSGSLWGRPGVLRLDFHVPLTAGLEQEVSLERMTVVWARQSHRRVSVVGGGPWTAGPWLLAGIQGVLEALTVLLLLGRDELHLSFQRGQDCSAFVGGG